MRYFHISVAFLMHGVQCALEGIIKGELPSRDVYILSKYCLSVAVVSIMYPYLPLCKLMKNEKKGN